MLKRSLFRIAAFAIALVCLPLGAANAQVTITDADGNQVELAESHLRLGARLGEITGANQLYINALNAQRRDIIRALVSTNPDIAPTITEVVDEVYVEMAGTAENLFGAIAAVYASAYNEVDLTQIVAFFESDVGQTYVANQRATDQAVLQLSVNWGDQVSVTFLEQVRATLNERGVEF